MNCPFNLLIGYLLFTEGIHLLFSLNMEEESNRREGKCVASIWGTYLNGKRCLNNIHFGREIVWCGENWKIIHFSNAFISPSVNSSIHLFLEIILGLNV